MGQVQHYFGYVGSILHVNLTTRQIRQEPLNLEWAEKFLGGPGIGMRLLYDLLKPNIDPLSSENVMVFGTGPFLGTKSPGNTKCYMCTKYAMPASRDGRKYSVTWSMFGGGRLGRMMKNAGYDHIVITGRADKPCYLKVADTGVEICDAGDLWGKDVYETGRILRERHGGRSGSCGTWVIGRAGENLVRFSLGWADDWWNAGRFAGAVAGAKNLKAIVTFGAKRNIEIANLQRFNELVDQKRQEIIKNPEYRFETFPLFSSKGRAGQIASETMVGRARGCGGLCACKTVHEIKEGKLKGAWWGGAGYDCFDLFVQPLLQIEDYREAFRIIQIMNSSGLCMNTSLNMMRFVSELFERGVISREEMGDIEVKIGDLDYYVALMEKILNREGIGAIMAEGWYPLCDYLGVDAATDWDAGCAITKGQDLIADCRLWPSLLDPNPHGFSPSYGLAPVVRHKAKHTHAVPLEKARKEAEELGLTEEEVGRVFKDNYINIGRLENYFGDAEKMRDALGICTGVLHWVGSPVQDTPWLAEMFSALTGFETNPRELLRVGERVSTLDKLINIREGFTREDDSCPPLYLQNTVKPLKAAEGDRYLKDWSGRRLTRGDLNKIRDDYYDERGWDVGKGQPTREKLIELGLEDFATVLES
jgi:aldehyde:ferredoxin oxidoreductase